MIEIYCRFLKEYTEFYCKDITNSYLFQTWRQLNVKIRIKIGVTVKLCWLQTYGKFPACAGLKHKLEQFG